MFTTTPKCRPYFKKVSPRSQIRDSGAVSQSAGIQTINVVKQNIDPKICYKSRYFSLRFVVKRVATNG